MFRKIRKMFVKVFKKRSKTPSNLRELKYSESSDSLAALNAEMRRRSNNVKIYDEVEYEEPQFNVIEHKVEVEPTVNHDYSEPVDRYGKVSDEFNSLPIYEQIEPYYDSLVMHPRPPTPKIRSYELDEVMGHMETLEKPFQFPVYDQVAGQAQEAKLFNDKGKYLYENVREEYIREYGDICCMDHLRNQTLDPPKRHACRLCLLSFRKIAQKRHHIINRHLMDYREYNERYEKPQLREYGPPVPQPNFNHFYNIDRQITCSGRRRKNSHLKRRPCSEFYADYCTSSRQRAPRY